MPRMMLLFALLAAAAAPSTPGATLVAAPLNPRAVELVDSDPAITAWAVRRYDMNRDGWLTLYEAQPAVAAFRDLADADRDGHVTVREFEAAVALLSVRN